MADNFYASYKGAGGGGSDPNAIDGLTGEVLATGPGTVPATLADGLTLRDGSGDPSVDADNRELLDSSDVLSISWENRVLQDNAATPSIDYNSRTMNDADGELSIDYQNRQLGDEDEDIQLTYDSNGVGLPLLTTSSALTLDSLGFIASSGTTDVELGYVSGVTSAIQTQINSKQSTAEKGAANGYASLDSGSKVPIAQLPSAIMEFKGAWNAATNSPTLADGAGDSGDVYRASVAGTQNLGSGAQTWAIGDLVIYNGSIWQHSPAADGVSSVNGATGAVTVNAINQLTGDVTAGPASGSQSQAATIANLAVTNAKIANTTIDLTTKVTGTLPVANGGTGVATLTTYSPIVGGTTGTGAVQQVTTNQSTIGSRLQSAGTSAVPTWSNISTTVVFALTDGATPAIDASKATVFTLTSTQNPTIAVPTNPIDGQKITIAFTASGGTRTLALNSGAGGFKFGSDITALTATPSGTIDYVGCMYNTTSGFWNVVAYVKGF